MKDWTEGYIADIGYTFGYFKELNPHRMRLALLNSGVKIPKQITACELGFGQGLSAAIHAAASDIKWYGNDFLPGQAKLAQSLVEAAGADAEFSDESFAEFLAREDLPKFDFICLHGVWTWVSDQNRSLILQFIQKNLKVGGVVYLSYNTQIGWAQIMPLRRLLVQHTERMGAKGAGSAQKIRDSLKFAEKLFATQTLHAHNNSQVQPKLQELLSQDPHYLAHEYYNKDWLPMDFADLSEQMAAHKLEYIASANYLDLIEAINHTPEQIKFLNEISDIALRENARDFMVDKKFRKDYWAKGVLELNQYDMVDALRAERVVLTKNRGAVSLVFEGALGFVDLSPEIYDPILDFLADYQPHSLAEIEQAMSANPQIGLQEIVQAMLLFTHRGDLQTAQTDEQIAKALPKTTALNLHLIKLARGEDKIHHLASPVTGGGIDASRIQQLMILGYQQGKQTLEELVNFVWQIFVSQGEPLKVYGGLIYDDSKAIVELTDQANGFLQRDLPRFKALRVCVG